MGRVVFITGGTSGFGIETARRFKQSGDTVIIAARNFEKVKDTVKKCGFDDGFSLDVSNYENWIEVKNSIIQNYGRLDVLINNAGCGGIIDTIQMQTKESIDMVIDTNLKGVIYGCNVFAPHMIELEEGTIINVASVAAREHWASWTLYCASKAAVLSFSKSLYAELKNHKIRVSAILPGGAITGFQKECNIDEGGESMTAWDVADAILYCVNLSKDVVVEEITLKGIIN